MRRRKSQDENVLILLRDLTESIWQIGAVASGVFFILGACALRWAYLQNQVLEQSGVITEALTKSYGWIFYSAPLVLMAFSYFYGMHSYSAYKKSY